MRLSRILPAVLLIVLAACDRQNPQTENEPPAVRDIFSFANTTEFTTRHLSLDLDVDFEQRSLRGTATLNMERVQREAKRIMLDTRDLSIAGVEVRAPGKQAQPAEFQLLDKNETLGTPLAIDLPEGVTEAEFTLEIHYDTHPDSTALQWLPPELTAGGEHPYMFSQSQSIHARSWVPLQDTPAVRITYDATIRTPPELLAVMSADNDPAAQRTGEYHFEMPQPIPSYLLAIAVGDIWFEPIGERTGVYSEPATLPASAFEFADTQAMLEATEAVYGPYQWGRYDLLILPPSFPFGGMENPRLSFITPSVLAGDRSLVSLIAHELAHSWSGNLVTNATWRDIWLNEGITSYLDARLIEILYGRERADEERLLSYRELLEQLEWVSPDMQALAPNLEGGDPDESQGSVHYAKGQLFLQHLEAKFGRERFDDFLAAYFNHFQWQSITTEQFLDYLDQNLLSAQAGVFSRAQAEEWIYQPGVPADAVLPSSVSLEQAAAAALAWANGDIPGSELNTANWSPQAIVQFINSLPGELENAHLDDLDAALGLSASGNAIVRRAWFSQVAARRYEAAYGHMREHLQGTGRIYLIQPVYKALADNGVDADLARDIFAAAEDSYHPLTRMIIARQLESE